MPCRLRTRSAKKLDDIKLYCDYFNQVGGPRPRNAGCVSVSIITPKEFEKREGEVIYDYMVANTDP